MGTSLITLETTVRDGLKGAQVFEQKRDAFLQSAGTALKELKERKPEGVTWKSYVREKFDLSQERADELIRIATGKTTVEKTRAGKAARQAKSKRRLKERASASGTGNTPAKSNGRKPQRTACDYDWTNPNPEDFGDPSEMYGKQSDHYFSEAIHLAESLPLLANDVALKMIRSKISGAQAVADAWLRTVSKLKSRLEVSGK